MATENDITDAINDRIHKAKNARNTIRNIFITNHKIDTKLTLNYYNALITAILLYSTHIHPISDTALKELQSPHSHFIRYMTHGKYNPDTILATNLQLRRIYLAPTTNSRLKRRYIIQTHTWINNMSSAHLNNRDKINIELNNYNQQLLKIKQTIDKQIRLPMCKNQTFPLRNIFITTK